MRGRNLALCFLRGLASNLPELKVFYLNDLAADQGFGMFGRRPGKIGGRGIKSAKRLSVCYTAFALITSVVLCGPSGAVFDLRFPACSFLRKFYA